MFQATTVGPVPNLWQTVFMRSGAQLGWIFFWLCFGCDPDRPRSTGGAPVGVSNKGVGVNQKKNPRPLATASLSEATAPPPKAIDSPAQPASPYGELTTLWKLNEVQDIGPAGPATATPEGVLFVTLDDRLLLSKRRGAQFSALEEPAERFAKYGRGPAVTATHAYWVAQRGKLLSASRGAGETKVVASSARSGTRVSARSVADRDVVAFIADVDENPRAFVWAEGEREPIALSQDASTASSVQLVQGAPHPRALVLEGRTGMSPIHVRTVRVTKRHVTLAEDEVIWIAPGAQPLTELVTLGSPDGEVTMLMAVAREVTEFGLGYLEVPDAGPVGTPKWRIFPNGIDPAPVAAAHVCKRNYVFFVLPTEAQPGSPQELRVALLDDAGQLVQEEILARSRAFNDVSVAAAPTGAVLAWTADRRTWASFIGCP